MKLKVARHSLFFKPAVINWRIFYLLMRCIWAGRVYILISQFTWLTCMKQGWRAVSLKMISPVQVRSSPPQIWSVRVSVWHSPVQIRKSPVKSRKNPEVIRYSPVRFSEVVYILFRLSVCIQGLSHRKHFLHTS